MYKSTNLKLGCYKLTYQKKYLEVNKNYFQKELTSKESLNFDYSKYLFGSQMPGRSFSTPSYRYGFNGMEKESDITGVDGGHLDFGARIYDSRLGRWLSVDPLDMKYPDIAPFVFVANNPINYIDPDGKRIKGVKIKDGNFIYTKAALKRGTDRYINARIKTTKGMEKIIALVDAKKTYTISVTDKVLVMATPDGKYGIAGGGADSYNNNMIVGLNKARFDNVTDEELKDAVTIDEFGNVIPISVKRENLINPMDNLTENQYLIDYQKAKDDSGITDYEKENPKMTEEQAIHAFGAHEETHWTEDNIKHQEKGDTYNTEKKAFEVELEERKEYIKENPNP